MQTETDTTGTLCTGNINLTDDSMSNIPEDTNRANIPQKKRVRLETPSDSLSPTHNNISLDEKRASPPSAITQAISKTQEDLNTSTIPPPSSTFSFFNKDKHQQRYFLSEHGNLFINTLPHKKGFLLNAVPLGYKIILMTNGQRLGDVEPQHHINPEHYFIMLGTNFDQI